MVRDSQISCADVEYFALSMTSNLQACLTTVVEVTTEDQNTESAFAYILKLPKPVQRKTLWKKSLDDIEECFVLSKQLNEPERAEQVGEHFKCKAADFFEKIMQSYY